MKIGVNSFLWTANFGPEQFSILPRVKEWGFDAFEIPVFDPAKIELRAIRKELEANQLECTLCAILPPGFSPIGNDAAVRANTRKHLRRCTELTAEMGATILSGPVYAPVGYLPGRRRTEDEWQWAVDCFQELGPVLEEYGVTLAIEPLNRFETFFLNTLSDTAALCDAIGHPRIGILLDTFHANIEEKSIPDACRMLGSRLRHVHACENDRGIPGTGHVDFPGIAKALHETGYDGYLTIESFGFNLPEMSAAAAIWRDLAPTPDAIAREGIAYLVRCELLAELSPEDSNGVQMCSKLEMEMQRIADTFSQLGLFRVTAWLFATAILLIWAANAKASPRGSDLAATPPMGWANWNSLGCNYDDSKIRAIADQMVSSGMRNAGYRYLIIQECIVPAGHRDASGALLPDPQKFPHGIPSLVDYIHSKGLKAGIYTDLGPLTCAKYEGSFQHEEQDARTFASWGIDLVEEDFCFKPEGFTASQLYARMADAIARSGRPMLFYICNWGNELAWTWAPHLANVWRSTQDVGEPGSAEWDRILRNFDQNALHAASGGRNHWSDPDMLEIGVPGINSVEEQSVFSLWAISAAPLWAGNDLTVMSPETQQILTNSEIIAVDQDPLGQPATLVLQDQPGLQVWARPLAGRDSPQAVLLFNRTASKATMRISWENLGIYGAAEVRDLWLHRDLGVLTREFEADVPAHGVVLLRVVPHRK